MIISGPVHLIITFSRIIKIPLAKFSNNLPKGLVVKFREIYLICRINTKNRPRIALYFRHKRGIMGKKINNIFILRRNFTRFFLNFI